MSNIAAPDHTTHQPIKVLVSNEDDVIVERPRLHTPSLWQEGVQVTHREDATRTGTVRRVDWVTRQFRLVGQGRTIWESFENWIVLVEKTPEEKAKDEARDLLRMEIEALDPDDLQMADAFLDAADPAKALTQLAAFRKKGLIGKAAPAKGGK